MPSLPRKATSCLTPLFGPLVRVSFDEEIAAVVVAQGKLGQPDDEVPLMLVSLVSQTRQRGIDVLRAGSERLADYLDVPGAVMVAVRWGEVLDPMRHLGGRGWISHETDVEGLHWRHVPTALAHTRQPTAKLGSSARSRSARTAHLPHDLTGLLPGTCKRRPGPPRRSPDPHQGLRPALPGRWQATPASCSRQLGPHARGSPRADAQAPEPA